MDIHYLHPRSDGRGHVYLLDVDLASASVGAVRPDGQYIIVLETVDGAEVEVWAPPAVARALETALAGARLVTARDSGAVGDPGPDGLRYLFDVGPQIAWR